MMTCTRCQGLMVLEYYWDFHAQCAAWHCINCGDVLDRTILKHRRVGAPQVQTSTVRRWKTPIPM